MEQLEVKISMSKTVAIDMKLIRECMTEVVILLTNHMYIVLTT
jgi:hypothetical protein